MASIRAQIFSLPAAVEPSAVTTAGHYILSTHVLRSLTKIDRVGNIKGDLAKKWETSENRLAWSIELAPAKFSNGDLILASDVVASIKRQMKYGSGVHFKFSQIKSVEVINDRKLEIKLLVPNANFAYDLSKPEFGVLHESEVGKDKGELIFRISSGPYYVKKSEGNIYYLERNTHYLEDVRNEHSLVIESSSRSNSVKLLSAEAISFFVTQEGLKLDEHKKLLSLKALSAKKPHVGFSYWISPNPKSKIFSSKSERSKLQMLTSKFDSKEFGNHTWEKADQLYLPDGDGRPSVKELKSVWDKILAQSKNSQRSGKKKIRVLPLKTSNLVLDDLLVYLNSFYDIEMLSYSSEAELVNIVRSGSFDLKISSNDFSSVDLLENLKTTFNDSRPYVFLPKGHSIFKDLDRASQEELRDSRSKHFKNIGTKLLVEGWVAPIAYQRVWFYSVNKIDFSQWSDLFPEISFWKVKINE